MKKNVIAKRLGVTHSAVSQWMSGLTKPSYENMLILEEEFGIPFRAWLDIKSFISNRDTKPKQKRGVS